jgi:hypothetical protein
MKKKIYNEKMLNAFPFLSFQKKIKKKKNKRGENLKEI